MKIVTILLVAYASSASSQSCKPPPERIISVLQTEVDTYDEFIFRRYLTTEWYTCSRANETMERLQDNFLNEVEAMMKKAVLQIRTVENLVVNTSADSCVNALDRELSNFIDRESSSFRECLKFPMLRLTQSFENLNDQAGIYFSNHKTTKQALDDCWKNFPNDCLNATTNNCIKTNLETFVKIGQDITENMHRNSSCMLNFEESLGCFTKSTQKIAQRADRALKKLASCADLTDDDSLKERITTFYKPFQVQTDLAEQVKYAQKKYYQLNRDVVATLTEYYKQEKTARMRYEFQPHDLGHFQRRLEDWLRPYLDKVQKVRPGNDQIAQCFVQARNNMLNLVTEGAQRSMGCEQDILAKTQSKMASAREMLTVIISELSRLGNLAILECLENSNYILAGNAVRDCYDLRFRCFKVDKSEILNLVNLDVDTVKSYNSMYFDSPLNPLICGSGDYNRTQLLADCILFEHSQCLYQATGDPGSGTPGIPTTMSPPTKFRGYESTTGTLYDVTMDKWSMIN